MTTYTEMLEQPQIKQKIESLIGGHIMITYRNAGMKLFAEALDQLESNHETAD